LNPGFQTHPLDQEKSNMVKVSASVIIDVKPEAVFALITDLQRKTKLCPHTAVLGITRHPDGPVEPGTVFHHRVAVDGHIADYHNTVVEIVPGQRMVTQSDSETSFKIIVEVEPTSSGTRLTQEESFELVELILPTPGAKGRLGKFFRLIFGEGDVIRQGEESLARDIQEMQDKLQPRLQEWLSSIKCHLEKESQRLLV
jgi:uncharacterized protein YndB with AHSA1/START domain